MIDSKDLKLAVLIDADNVPYSNVKGMLDEVAKHGIPTIKRIYGDWTKRTVSGWKKVLLDNAINPVQQYSYTQGKNATDSAMIIDAMDILHSQKADGFCLVTSDSDFTRLATRLRESGKLVIGMGEKKTPKPFIVACDKFIYIEIIEPKEVIKSISYQKAYRISNEPEKIDDDFIALVKSSINDIADDDGWVFLGVLGNFIIKRKPEFDPRNYGFLKLAPLIKSLSEELEIDERYVENKHIKHIYVRIKSKDDS